MSMDPLIIAKAINSRIIELEGFKRELPELAKRKADTLMAYEKAAALETLTLISEGTAMSVIDKLVRGRCAALKGDLDLSESMYKNAMKIIDITQAQLNGYQSINRFLAEVHHD